MLARLYLFLVYSRERNVAEQTANRLRSSVVVETIRWDSSRIARAVEIDNAFRVPKSDAKYNTINIGSILESDTIVLTARRCSQTSPEGADGSRRSILLASW